MKYEVVDIKLNELNHIYQFKTNGYWLTPNKTISGSTFFKTYFNKNALPQSMQARITLAGDIAIKLGINIHYILEQLVNYYNIYRDIDILRDTANKYKEDNRMLYNTIHQVVYLLQQQPISSLKTEVAQGFYFEEADLLVCGTADLIINDKILVDYKTKIADTTSFVEFSFPHIFEECLHGVLQGIDYGLYEKENKIPYSVVKKYTEKSLNYIYQFGLYALLHNLDSIYMIVSDLEEPIRIGESSTKTLKEICYNRMIEKVLHATE
jgi:hypothetical protein